MTRSSKFSIVSLLLVILCVPAGYAQDDENPPQGPDDLQYDETAIRFVSLLLTEGAALQENFNHIIETWQPGYAAMSLDIMRLARRNDVMSQLFVLLRQNSDAKIGNTVEGWQRWLWNNPEEKYEHYAEFKSLLYRLVDPVFAGYFDDDRETTIRLDEVVWGGVRQDGIPPLRQPEMISAEEAEYLENSHVVFGVEINGDARAYPNRILAWHEMFVDEIGGVEFAGVYCTLCGAVILYETNHAGVRHEMGTSGFLYRSNKLMYDKATQSLWNTTWGRPVVGPLVDKDIELKRSYVVTTTWGEWKRRHPDTTVLSLNTGHQRDYGEGVAYQQYFATDELMFQVPQTDDRLKNKDEVLALYYPESGEGTMAISAEFLTQNPVYHDALGTQEFVVLTDSSGANRVYDSGQIIFKEFDRDQTATDQSGKTWTLSEDALTSESGETLPRLAAHRAFWFGWYAANKDTHLIF